MNIYTDFSSSFERIKEMVYTEFRSYRYPVRELTHKILETYKLLDENLSPKGIVFYLPLWLGTSFKIDNLTMEQLSLGNFFLTLSVDIKDKIKDNDINDYKMILLSDRLLVSAINSFRTVMGKNESFWKYFDDCLDQNINIRIDESSVTNVKNSTNKRFCSNKLLVKYHRVCEGGAFLRPAAVACLMLSNKENQILDFCNAIDMYHIGLKIIDDYVDWEDDLKFGSESLFLNCVREWLGHEHIEKLDVQRFVVASDFTEKMLSEAIECTESARQLIKKYDCSYFSAYLEKQVSSYVNLNQQLISSKSIIKCNILNDLRLWT